VTAGFEFDSNTFLNLSIRERAALCRKLAERAASLATAAEPHHRDGYREIARQWLILAENMEKTAT
jgi:hypothetical protein